MSIVCSIKKKRERERERKDSNFSYAFFEKHITSGKIQFFLFFIIISIKI